MNLLDTYIKKSIREKLFLDVYRVNYDSEPIFGYIAQSSTDLLCLRKFDENGEYSGISVIYTSDISHLGWGGNSRKSTEELIQSQNAKIDSTKLDLKNIEEALKSIQSEFGYLSVYSENNDSNEFYVGRIKELDSQYLLLTAFGTKESLDKSEFLLKLETITRIDADSKYERGIITIFDKI